MSGSVNEKTLDSKRVTTFRRNKRREALRTMKEGRTVKKFSEIEK